MCPSLFEAPNAHPEWRSDHDLMVSITTTRTQNPWQALLVGGPPGSRLTPDVPLGGRQMQEITYSVSQGATPASRRERGREPEGWRKVGGGGRISRKMCLPWQPQTWGGLPMTLHTSRRNTAGLVWELTLIVSPHSLPSSPILDTSFKWEIYIFKVGSMDSKGSMKHIFISVEGWKSQSTTIKVITDVLVFLVEWSFEVNGFNPQKQAAYKLHQLGSNM